MQASKIKSKSTRRETKTRIEWDVVRELGMHVATLVQAMRQFGSKPPRCTLLTTMLVSIAAMGCLVTDKVSVPEENNFPPSIISPPEARAQNVALDQIVQVHLPDETGTELNLPVLVRDPNMNQTLERQVWIDFSGSNLDALLPEDDRRVLPTGTLERSMTIRIPLVRLTPGCHKVELRVTSNFDGGANFREPVEDGDIAQAVWFIRVTDETVQTVEMGNCP